MRNLTAIVMVLLFAMPVRGDDLDAALISDRIQNFHMPHGVVGEARFDGPTSSTLVQIYDGDGAIWTGHYLAAESFRYAATGSTVALAYAKRTLQTIKMLVTISGSGKLSRTAFPADTPYVEIRLKDKDYHRTTYEGRDYYYRGNVTRDQYEGIYLGLAVAYDLIDDEEVHSLCRDLITRLTDYLIRKQWILYNPGGSIHLQTFIGRFDQMLSILQVAKHVNPSRFNGKYKVTRFFWSWLVGFPQFVHGTHAITSGYSGLNLDYGYFYNLIRLEQNSKIRKGYMKTYTKLRNATKSHLNPYFNMIDFALSGADEDRDRETLDELEADLRRNHRNFPVDLSGKYKACKLNIACVVIPVAERPYEDFLWQRHPFALSGGGDGSVESPNVDYILPYWMARYYGVAPSQ